MEGKGVRAVIMGVLLLGMVVAQLDAKSCCRNTTGRNCYNTCRFAGTPRPVCRNLCDCIEVSTPTCPASHPRSSMLENSGTINEYCKLGCASSVCDSITTTENSVVEGEVKEAVEYCNNACSQFCNKGAKIALASA